MYLKQINTSGFKSFANKINIELDNHITCIVGPNGSGKSNIVDAVRWVLGEQSIKSLRGDNTMSDIIFSGSKNRKPLNVASVELIFDNNDHFLNIPYTEISIKRRIYRSGENEYFLNNERCRLKDLTSLLLDSGIGRESFNIISQGEVDNILSSSPNDRRVIFEEVAGILKYKKRKIEALRKLDRTHNNLDRINDIISEIEGRVEPLKRQSRKALKYKEARDNLEKYEVSLLAFDINNANRELEKIETLQKSIEEEVIQISTESSLLDSKALEDANNISKLEKEIEENNFKLLQITEEVEKINSERELLKERKKHEQQEDEIVEEMRNLLEEKENIAKDIEVSRNEIDNLEKRINETKKHEDELKKEIEKEKNKRYKIITSYDDNLRKKNSNQYKLMAIKEQLDDLAFMPKAVASVLKEKDLKGIHDVLGNLIDTKDEYVKALETAIYASKNFIITENETSAKEAINYLKEKKIGRATFFPLSVIKPRYIDDHILNDLKDDPDFVGVLSDLVNYDKKYQNIVKNQLGTILISEDIDKALRLSKKVNKRYKIITLTGEELHIGGSMSGGVNKNAHSIIDYKHQLKQREDDDKTFKEMLEKLTLEKNDLDKTIKDKEQQYFEVTSSIVSLEESLNINKKEKEIKEKELEKISKDYESYQSVIGNSFDKKEQSLTEKYHQKTALKESLQQTIRHQNKTLDELKTWQEQKQGEEKVKNAHLRELEKKLSDFEVDKNRLNLTLDNMLNTLNEEYSLTYEKASKEYSLDIEVEAARKKVISYKKELKQIGMVDLDSIEEFERVNTRFEFLTKQRADLHNAEETLLSIMNDMDDVMIVEFEKTFKKIRIEFQKVFKELFKGGHADLILTEPEDLLTTGIEIVASPPGKKLTSISLLSGGEKTLTAISLLFATLNVRSVPFCLFDEVEAALDEANVLEFGKYLSNYKDKTQFLIITHKKKTMEYADTLYGITMQESGVSKLVSVKLNDKEEII